MVNKNGVEVFPINVVNKKIWFSKWDPNRRPIVSYYKDELFAESPYFPDYYIGNFGTIINKDGDIVHQRMSQGYMVVDIRGKENISDPCVKSMTIFVHRVVMITHDPRDNISELDVDHDNGIRHMNIYWPGNPLNNLEWTSHAENCRRAVRKGQVSNLVDAEHTISNMSDELVHKICRMYVDGKSTDQILEEIGYPNTQLMKTKMYALRTGKARKEITSLYNMRYKSPRHNEEEVEAICEVLQEIKRRGLSYTAVLVIAALDTFYGIYGVNDIFINNIHRKYPSVDKWRYIIDKYDF